MSTLVEEFEHIGLKCEIHYEEDQSGESPRDWENVGTMVCWHPDYYLGDYQIPNPDGRGAIKDRFHRDDFKSIEALGRYLSLVEKAACVLPLSLYEHSGISIFVGRSNPWDAQGWDTTTVGFIYAKATDEVEDLEKTLRSEVAIYDSYLRGEVYYWCVKDKDDEVLDSCGGYVGDLDYVRTEAKSNAEWNARDILINIEPNFPEGLRT